MTVIVHPYCPNCHCQSCEDMRAHARGENPENDRFQRRLSTMIKDTVAKHMREVD